jgi:hypothetical protein
MEDAGETSFLGSGPNAPTADLPPKSTDQTTGTTLTAIFPSSDISDDGSSVRASAVLRLYNALYDRIHASANSAQYVADLEKLQVDNSSLRTQLRTANQSILQLAANIAVDNTNNRDEQNRDTGTVDNTTMDPKKLLALQKEKYLIEHRPKQFTGTGTQVTVMDFIDQVEHFVWMVGDMDQYNLIV